MMSAVPRRASPHRPVAEGKGNRPGKVVAHAGIFCNENGPYAEIDGFLIKP